jgi:predicted DCC family thiol-disulfide oxidoreductase YuxK
MTPVPVLYDPDCGFCRVTRGRLRPVALGGEEANALLDGMTEEERMASWHLVDGEAVHSGGGAFPAVFARLPAGAPFARMTERFPTASERVYRWVADHRSLLGRPLPASARRWADSVISGSRPQSR